MAVEGPQPVKWSFIAGGDLSAKQYYAVKLSADNTVVVCAGTTDKPIGILQNNPASGGVAEVMLSGITKVSSDAALTAADEIGTSVDGQLATYVAGTDTTKYLIGRVLIGSAAANGLATAAINCLNASRGA